ELVLTTELSAANLPVAKQAPEQPFGVRVLRAELPASLQQFDAQSATAIIRSHRMPSPQPSPSGRGSDALTPTLSQRERERRPHPDPLPRREGVARGLGWLRLQ